MNPIIDQSVNFARPPEKEIEEVIEEEKAEIKKEEKQYDELLSDNEQA